MNLVKLTYLLVRQQTDRVTAVDTKVRTIVTIGLSLRPIVEFVALSDDYRSR